MGVIGGVVVIVCCGGIGILGSGKPGGLEPPHSIETEDNPKPTDPDTTIAVAPKSNYESPPPPPVTPVEVKLTDDDLYAVVDESYGLPIANLQTKAFIAALRSQGFEGPEAKIHPFGLPDAPEAKVTQSWYLTKELPGISFHAEVIGDLRGAVRNVQFVLVSKDGKPVTGKAKELLPPVCELLNRPKVTHWYIEHSGEKLVEDFDGTRLESVGGSPQFWMYTVRGSSSTTPPAPDPAPPAGAMNDYHAIRLWSDASGNFKVMASYVSFGNGVVKLKKEDGKTIDVPMEKLSVVDQAFINKKIRHK